MNQEKADSYFKTRYDKNDLNNGNNYMIDAENNVWQCVVMFQFDVWFVIRHSKDNGDFEKYIKFRDIALADPGFVFEWRN